MDLSIRIIIWDMLGCLGRCKALDLSILIAFLDNPDATIEERTSQSVLITEASTVCSFLCKFWWVSMCTRFMGDAV